jgi:hypothetical protein
MSEIPNVWVETRYEPAPAWSRWWRDDRTVHYVRTAKMTWGPFAHIDDACARAEELTQALLMRAR